VHPPVGDLDLDTRVEPTGEGDGRYRARLSPDWAIWGPNGGYLVSVALRAAGRALGRARPASIVAHLLGVAAFDEVGLDVEILRTSRFATSARVSMRQGDRPIVDALVWGIDPGGAALEHDAAPPPDVPAHDEIPSRAERLASIPEGEGPPPFAFFDNLDMHPIGWIEDWPPPGPLDPVTRSWLRFRPTATFDDPWVDACRLLVPIDTFGWPAASGAHAHLDPLPVVAVTVDLSVRFHRPTGDEWLLSEAISPVGAGGLTAATGRVWDRAGRLLASGGQTMLCRPAGPVG
jgi:acyl-CoA thioesterase